MASLQKFSCYCSEIHGLQKPFCLTGNASDVGAGALLLQLHSEDIGCPVAYFVRN